MNAATALMNVNYLNSGKGKILFCTYHRSILVDAHYFYACEKKVTLMVSLLVHYRLDRVHSHILPNTCNFYFHRHSQ